MKKFLKVCICATAAVTLIAGCSKKEDTTAATTAAETTTEAAETETAAELVDLSTIDYGTVTLGKYKGIEVVKNLREVTDDEVKKSLVMSLAGSAEYADVDRPVQLGDKVNIDYEGTKDGVAFDGGTAEGSDLTIGSGTFIDGFEDGLIGAKKGDELTLPLTFPANYQSTELAGQAVEFKVKINNIQGFDVNDALVADTTEYKTVDEYRQAIRDGYIADAEEEANYQIESQIITAVVNDSTIEPSQEAIDANYQNYVANYTNQATAYGMDLAQMASTYGMDEDAFKEQLKVMAESAVKQNLVLTAIADAENITITDEDRDKAATDNGFTDRDTMIQQAGDFAVDSYIISTKVMDFLVENAVIK